MTATDQPPIPEQLKSLPPELAAEQLPAKLGIEIVDWSPDALAGTMPVAGNRQPFGLLHGGANAVLAETLGSICAALNVPEGRIVLGLELSCTHHRAAHEGHVTGVARPIHSGRSTAAVEVVITDEAGRRTCTARLTCIVRERPPSGKR
ncbi:MAG: hotdog fold thioesterase [Sciscionella sp.]